MNKIKRFPAVGQCIYCDAAGASIKLSDEHIIPFALGGKDILLEASCSKCARKINKGFETHCSQRLFQTIRVHHRYPTRNPKKRPTHLPIIETVASDS